MRYTKITFMLLAVIAMLLLTMSCVSATVLTRHLCTDDAMLDLIKSQAFAAEGRIGDNGNPANRTFELDLGQFTSAPYVKCNYVWPNCQEQCFRLEYNSVTNKIKFIVDGKVLCFTPVGSFSDLFIRTRAVKLGTSICVHDLVLNCVPVCDESFADGPNGLDILQIAKASLKTGFVLEGKVKLCWVTIPKNSELAFQIIGAQVENEATCFAPVTFTQLGWKAQCSPQPGFPETFIYPRLPLAFKDFYFFGTLYHGRVIIGAPTNVLAFGNHSITFYATTYGIDQICRFFPQTGDCDRLFLNYVNPSVLLDENGCPTENELAGETLALTLNIAFNDMRLMPRFGGYDLECFTLTSGLLKGKTVGQVLNIANSVLAGKSPQSLGLPCCDALVDILAKINANYEFTNFDTFVDRGYLRPNVPLGTRLAPHPMVVPSTCVSNGIGC